MFGNVRKKKQKDLESDPWVEDKTFRANIEKVIRDMWKGDGNESQLPGHWTKNTYMRDGTYVAVDNYGIYEIIKGNWKKRGNVKDFGLHIQKVEPNWGNFTPFSGLNEYQEAVKRDSKKSEGQRQAAKIKTEEELNQYDTFSRAFVFNGKSGKTANKKPDIKISDMSDDEVNRLIHSSETQQTSEANSEELY